MDWRLSVVGVDALAERRSMRVWACARVAWAVARQGVRRGEVMISVTVMVAALRSEGGSSISLACVDG